jgi:hypothetical protein
MSDHGPTLIESARNYLGQAPSSWLQSSDLLSGRIATWAIERAKDSPYLREHSQHLEEECLSEIVLSCFLHPSTVNLVAELADDTEAPKVICSRVVPVLLRLFSEDMSEVWQDARYIATNEWPDHKEDYDTPGNWFPADLHPAISSYSTKSLFDINEIISLIPSGATPSSASPSARESSLVRLDVIDMALYRTLAEHPEFLSTIPWRTFEKLLADILARFGYDIELQQGTKDGGIDLFAIKRMGPFGLHKYLIQAKRWTHKVGVEPVQQLLFLHDHHGMTKSCLATTAAFTKGAYVLAEQYRWQLELRDMNGLQEWIRRVVSNEK